MKESKLTREEYEQRWQDPRYAGLVVTIAFALNTDGCSGVPDFYVLGCYEHDISYRTGRDAFGNPITREEADLRLRWFIQMKSPARAASPMSWWRWLYLKLFASKNWDGTQPLPYVRIFLGSSPQN